MTIDNSKKLYGDLFFKVKKGGEQKKHFSISLSPIYIYIYIFNVYNP